MLKRPKGESHVLRIPKLELIITWKWHLQDQNSNHWFFLNKVIMFLLLFTIKYSIYVFPKM